MVSPVRKRLIKAVCRILSTSRRTAGLLCTNNPSRTERSPQRSCSTAYPCVSSSLSIGPSGHFYVVQYCSTNVLEFTGSGQTGKPKKPVASYTGGNLGKSGDVVRNEFAKRFSKRKLAKHLYTATSDSPVLETTGYRSRSTRPEEFIPAAFGLQGRHENAHQAHHAEDRLQQQTYSAINP
jgi:hypothetical protein